MLSERPESLLFRMRKIFSHEFAFEQRCTLTDVESLTHISLFLSADIPKCYFKKSVMCIVYIFITVGFLGKDYVYCIKLEKYNDIIKEDKALNSIGNQPLKFKEVVNLFFLLFFFLFFFCCVCVFSSYEIGILFMVDTINLS